MRYVVSCTIQYQFCDPFTGSDAYGYIRTRSPLVTMSPHRARSCVQRLKAQLDARGLACTYDVRLVCPGVVGVTVLSFEVPSALNRLYRCHTFGQFLKAYPISRE